MNYKLYFLKYESEDSPMHLRCVTCKTQELSIDLRVAEMRIEEQGEYPGGWGYTL